jgi:hypothetical protein
MRILGRWARTLGIGAAVFLLFGVVVGIAGAQRPDGGQQSPPQRGDRAHGQAGELRDEYITRLAENLGLPEQTVRDALAKTRDDMRPLLQERFQQARERFRDRAQDPAFRERLGELRQRLEERFRDNGGSTPFPGRDGFPGGMPPFGPGGPAMGMGPFMGPRILQLGAEILSLSPEELRQDLAQGMTLSEIAQQQGVQPSAFADQLATRLEQQQSQAVHDRIEQIMNQQFQRPGGPAGQPGS